MNLLKNKWFQFLLIIPFFEPIYFDDQLPTLDNIYIIARVAAFLLLAVQYFLIKRRISKVVFVIVLFQLTLILSTIVNKGDVWTACVQIANIVGVCMWVELTLYYGFLNTARCLLYILAVFTVVNLVTVVLYPEGMYEGLAGAMLTRKNWFLGYYNAHIFTLLPCVCIALLFSHFKNRRMGILTVIITAVAAVSIVLVWSATSLVAITAVVLFILIMYNRNFSRVFNFWTYSVVIAVAFFSIVIFRLQDYFSFLIEGALGKNLTFTGRIYIWDAAIEHILKQPILGNGLEYAAESTKKLWGFTSPHNYFLGITYQGGAIALALFLVLVVMVGRKLYKNRTNQLSAILSFTIFVYFIISLTEHYNAPVIFALYTMAYHVEEIIAQHSLVKAAPRRVSFVWGRGKVRKI